LRVRGITLGQGQRNCFPGVRGDLLTPHWLFADGKDPMEFCFIEHEPWGPLLAVGTQSVKYLVMVDVLRGSTPVHTSA
jgi:hypothetical protein